LRRLAPSIAIRPHQYFPALLEAPLLDDFRESVPRTLAITKAQKSLQEFRCQRQQPMVEAGHPKRVPCVTRGEPVEELTHLGHVSDLHHGVADEDDEEVSAGPFVRGRVGAIARDVETEVGGGTVEFSVL